MEKRWTHRQKSVSTQFVVGLPMSTVWLGMNKVYSTLWNWLVPGSNLGAPCWQLALLADTDKWAYLAFFTTVTIVTTLPWSLSAFSGPLCSLTQIMVYMCSRFSHVRLFAIPWTVAHQAPHSSVFDDLCVFHFLMSSSSLKFTLWRTHWITRYPAWLHWNYLGTLLKIQISRTGQCRVGD